MINLSLIESSIFFFQSKLDIYCLVFSPSDQASLGLKKDKKNTKDVDVSNAPCCPTPTVLSPKNIPVAMAVRVIMSSPSPIGFLAAVASTVDPSSSVVVLIFFSDDHAYSFYCVFF